MLKVLITVDVELWPPGWNLNADAFHEAWRRYILGATPKGDYGLPFQLELLDHYSIKANFFVESLFAWQYGTGPLREITGMIQEADQEVQLHVHAEWTHKSKQPILPGRNGLNLYDYDEADQEHLVSLGLNYLKQNTKSDVTAFRAGNYGANLTTLKVLAKYGMSYDTSYNQSYLARTCGIKVREDLRQPCALEGIIEFPITVFEELPGKLKHMQICACSLNEMKHLLMKAYASNWHSVVIVSHGHELLNAERTKPNPIVIKRFEGLCKFLADNTDKFETIGFNALNMNSDLLPMQKDALTSDAWRTAWRYGEQIAMHFFK